MFEKHPICEKCDAQFASQENPLCRSCQREEEDRGVRMSDAVRVLLMAEAAREATVTA